jgi:hypothetical protein
MDPDALVSGRFVRAAPGSLERVACLEQLAVPALDPVS